MKRTTAEVISHNWNFTASPLVSSQAGAGITIRDINSGKKKKFSYLSNFPHRFFRGLKNGDIIEFDYTESSSWFPSFFSCPEITNVVAKLRETTLEQQLAKSPRTGTNAGDAMWNKVISRYPERAEYAYKSEVRLRGSLQGITKFIFETVQDVEGFEYFEPSHFDGFRDITKVVSEGVVVDVEGFENFEPYHLDRDGFNEDDVFFICGFSKNEEWKEYSKEYWDDYSSIGILIEPVDSTNVIVHVAGLPKEKPPASIPLKTVVMRIIEKLSQSNR
jgi:hypothetical protein